jgi:hypothetical protein
VVKVVEQLSTIGIFTVSFPEALILTVLGIIAIGNFGYFKSKKNFLRIVLMAVVIALTSNFLREALDNEIESTVINIFVISLLYIFIARLKFYKSIMAALFSMIIIAVIQTPAVIGVSAISGLTYSEAFKNDFLLVLFVLPERILEIVLICLSMRFNLKIIDLESTNIKKKAYYVQLLVYIISICTLVFLSLLMVKILISDNGNLNSSNSTLLRLNVYLTLFVTVVLTLAVRNTHEHYKNKNKLNNNEIMQSLDYIKDLIEEKELSEASSAIDSLKIHISSTQMKN